MSNNEIVRDIVKQSLRSSRGIISMLYDRYRMKYSDANSYLRDTILKKGTVDKNDMETAARLFAISKMEKEYKNIAKILEKSELLYEKWSKESADINCELDEDWLNYFFDKAKNISDEVVQNLWAGILAGECLNEGGFRRVMLDRLALLDRKSASLFQLLCELTYELEISDGRTYSIPLYLRNDSLYNMIEREDIFFERNDFETYQQYFTLNGENLSYIQVEEELELLQDIGLIELSSECDDNDVYSVEDVNYFISIGRRKNKVESQYDEKQNIYYVITGNARFTRIGIELYNILSKNLTKPEFLFNLVNEFMKYQKNI